MDGNGKYDREDLVRIAQAVFGPAIEIDTMKGVGYFVDLLENDGTIKMKAVARIASEKSADLLAKKVLSIAGIEHKNWPETVGKVTITKWETMDSLVGRLRATRPMVAAKVREQLSKEAASVQ